jgi:hypothetical protein
MERYSQVGSTVRSCAARKGELSSRSMKVLNIFWKENETVCLRVNAGISQNLLAANEILRFIGIHFVW